MKVGRENNNAIVVHRHRHAKFAKLCGHRLRAVGFLDAKSARSAENATVLCRRNGEENRAEIRAISDMQRGNAEV